tara:strand:- start:670 stop:1620 length:951 start_codon:yes stop_codon:yes gene_type:complete
MAEEVSTDVFLGVRENQLITSAITEDTRRLNPDHLKQTFFPDAELHYIDKMVLIHNPWTHNFQHFIDETLPLCIECKDVQEVYVTVWPSFADDILEFLGIKNIKKIPDNTCFLIKRLVRKKLIYSDFRLDEERNVNKPLRHVTDKVKEFLSKKRPRFLFIKRDVDRRNCKNINEVIYALKLKYNVDVVDNFSDLKVRERIVTLNYYDIVIGMYGATSANVVFKNSGRWIILSGFAHREHHNKFIGNLNKDLTIDTIDCIAKYTDVSSIQHCSSDSNEQKDFVIDVDSCLEKMEEILNPKPPKTKPPEPKPPEKTKS